MTQETRRPMPGPPDTLPPVRDLSRPPVGPDGRYDWETWRRWREQDDWEWRTIREKRLTDAECAAEYWRASFDCEDYSLSDGYGDGIVEPISRARWWMRDPINNDQRKATWHRFATRPHALEEA